MLYGHHRILASRTAGDIRPQHRQLRNIPTSSSIDLSEIYAHKAIREDGTTRDYRDGDCNASGVIAAVSHKVTSTKTSLLWTFAQIGATSDVPGKLIIEFVVIQLRREQSISCGA